MFTHCFAKISIPLCSSAEPAVILKYMHHHKAQHQEDVLLLELVGDRQNACDFFDCRFVSDFANEDPVVFLGGFERLRFNAVIDVWKGTNYGLYLRAINVFNHIIKRLDRSRNVDQQQNVSRHSLQFSGWTLCVFAK